MEDITLLDPAGNITAVVEGNIQYNDRLDFAKKILNENKAEQVGFVAAPKFGGECRLEMMGGEFCGNATRAYGYHHALKKFGSGRHIVPVEISGINRPIEVNVDLDNDTAYTDMPLPISFEEVRWGALVHCEGIDHLIVDISHLPPSYDIMEAGPKILNELLSTTPLNSGALGIMFINGKRLTPLVYVRGTDSLVWESSCGSGSVAVAWYLYSKNLNMTYSFVEPGGTINVLFEKLSSGLVCLMGGSVSIL